MKGVGLLVSVYHVADWVFLQYADGRFTEKLTPEQAWNALESVLELVAADKSE